MKCNIGNGDRLLRILVGSLLFGYGFLFQSWWGLAGIIPLVTASFRWCPLYVPFKMKTSRDDKLGKTV